MSRFLKSIFVPSCRNITNIQKQNINNVIVLHFLEATKKDGWLLHEETNKSNIYLPQFPLCKIGVIVPNIRGHWEN